MLRVKRLFLDSHDIGTPEDGNAGYDLPAYDSYLLSPGWRTTIQTGLAVEIPPGFCGIILGRSGLAFKNDIYMVHIGLIDSSYRGEILVRVENKSKNEFYVEDGARIAQLLIVPCFNGKVQYVNELSESVRGEQGFGSSGLAALLTQGLN